MNEQAFPLVWTTEANQQRVEYGMTLRDYFAAKVILGLYSNPNMIMAGSFDFDRSQKIYERFSRIAEEQADEMLKERNE